MDEHGTGTRQPGEALEVQGRLLEPTEGPATVLVAAVDTDTTTVHVSRQDEVLAACEGVVDLAVAGDAAGLLSFLVVAHEQRDDGAGARLVVVARPGLSGLGVGPRRKAVLDEERGHGFFDHPDVPVPAVQPMVTAVDDSGAAVLGSVTRFTHAYLLVEACTTSCSDRSIRENGYFVNATSPFGLRWGR